MPESIALILFSVINGNSIELISPLSFKLDSTACKRCGLPPGGNVRQPVSLYVLSVRKQRNGRNECYKKQRKSRAFLHLEYLRVHYYG
jgi:hypothetical protein